MAFEIRRFGIILAVAVLFTIFVFALADAVTPEEDYPDFCQQSQDDRPYYEVPYRQDLNCSELAPPAQEEIDACPGTLVPDYQAGQCPEQYICDCRELVQEYQQTRENIQFWIAVILGFIAIAAGMMLPSSNELNEWVGGGFILGGVLTLFIATAMHWSDIHRIARPLVIAGELALVLWIAYKRFGPSKGRSKEK